MLMCSDSIAHLAGALAKAQVELTNPVKSCTAVLERGRGGSGGAGGAVQTYRYAPLSAGLDIVRKALGQHEIAVIQATEVDRESGTVLLTTTLAHGSGEWIAAKWPVCRVSDMSQPKVMGAALTYARRYGLFSLVGLAGEDDLDAVDLASGEVGGSQAEVVDLARVSAREGGPVGPAGPQVPMPSPTRRMPRSGSVRHLRARGRVSDPDTRRREETSLSDLEAALAQVSDEAELLRWALSALPSRYSLSDEARAALEGAFLARAEAIGADPDLLAAFSGLRGRGKTEQTGSAQGGEHDAQASA
jgi:hypothetical protein